MSIEVRIPKEIKKYKTKLIFGLTLRRFISCCIAIAINLPLYLHGRKFLGDELTSWLIIIVVIPIAGIGFFEYNGMTFEMFLLEYIKSNFITSQKRIYKTENKFEMNFLKNLNEHDNNKNNKLSSTKVIFKNKFNPFKKRISKSVQKSIPFKEIHDNNGIIEISKGIFSKSIYFDDINYQIAQRDEQERIFVRYAELINLFDSNVNVQITINNKNIDKKQFEDQILFKYMNNNLDEFRMEFNNILKNHITSDKNEIRKEKYITLNIKAKDMREAENKFILLETEVMNSLNKIGSNSYVLETKDRFKLLYEIYNNKSYIGINNIDVDNLKSQGITLKDILAPDSLLFKNDYMIIGDRYARALYLKDLPSGLDDEFLSQLTECDFTMLTTINISSVAPEDALKIVNRQIASMNSEKLDRQKKASKDGYDPNITSGNIENDILEAKELLDDLRNKNQKMIIFNLVIVHFGKSIEELNMQTMFLENAARKHLCSIGKLCYQQESGLNSSIPLGINNLYTKRTLTTESTSVFMPFTSCELMQDNGIYYGLNATTGNLIIFNRKSLKNANGFVLGSSGSGKSFFSKEEIVNVLLSTDDDIIVIDPENEYLKLANNFNGLVVDISPSSKNHINPFDMSEDYSDEDNPLLLKADFIISLCDLLISSKHGITGMQRSIIDRCVSKVYEKYIAEGFNEDNIPVLYDFYQLLKKQPEPQIQDLAISLEMYAEGNLSVFSNKTNIDIDNRLIVYNIKDLGKNLKNMGMLIILDSIWNRIIKNRKNGKRTWIYIDEIHLLFKNEYSANFLLEIWKRARKWGGIPTGITQDIEDLLESETARMMLSNSEFISILNQSPVERDKLAALLKISDAQLSYITNAQSGQGLLFTGTNIVPFINRLPKNSNLFKLMETDPNKNSNNEK